MLVFGSEPGGSGPFPFPLRGLSPRCGSHRHDASGQARERDREGRLRRNPRSERILAARHAGKWRCHARALAGRHCNPARRRRHKGHPRAKVARRLLDRDERPDGCSCGLAGHRTSHRSAAAAVAEAWSAAAGFDQADTAPREPASCRRASPHPPRVCQVCSQSGRVRTVRVARQPGAARGRPARAACSRRFYVC